MICEDIERLDGPYLDGELDLQQTLQIDDHVAGCALCRGRLQTGRDLSSALRAAPYFTAPPALTSRIRAVGPLPATDQRQRPRRRFSAWLAAAAMVAIAAATAAVLMQRQNTASVTKTANAIVDHHVASLMAGHLTDVASSDRHTVKPWLAGRIDFSPPVADLTPSGFPLEGGRLEYVDGHGALALVYARGAHVINVFTWPTTDADADEQQAADPRGYQLVHWTRDHFTWWVVSDLASADVNAFAKALAAEHERLHGN